MSWSISHFFGGQGRNIWCVYWYLYILVNCDVECKLPLLPSDKWSFTSESFTQNVIILGEVNSYPYNVRICIYLYFYICMCVFKHYHIQIYIYSIHRMKHDDIRTCFTFSPLCYLCVKTRCCHKPSQEKRHMAIWRRSLALGTPGGSCENLNLELQGPVAWPTLTTGTRILEIVGWQIGFPSPYFFVGDSGHEHGYMGSKIKEKSVIYEPAVLNLLVE